DGDPQLGVALAGAHAGLGRLLGDRLVREDVDPDLAATADRSGHRDTGSLDLAGREPARLEGLDAVLAEAQVGAALGDTLGATALVLAVGDLTGHQHDGLLAPALFGAGAAGDGLFLVQQRLELG